MCKKPLGDASLIMTTGVLGLRRFTDVDRHRSDYLPVTGQVQNVQKGNVYVFGNADVTEEEVNTNNAVEMSELRVRGKNKTLQNDVSRTQNESGQNSFIERIIIPGDTLQVFALQYGCPISEIKRINNLISDQDFHALTKIKLPVRRYGLLQEEDEERRRRPEALTASAALTTSNGSLDEEPTSPSDESGEEHSYRTISIRMKDESDKRKFLKRMDKDLQKICQETKTSKDSLDEVTKELTVPRFYPLRREQSSMNWMTNITCDVISWKSIVLIMLAVVIGSIVVAFAIIEKYL